jgi:hypothetical protein
MNEQHTQLPHQRLIAFHIAKDFLLAVIAAKIRDAEIRDQATRTAKGCALNIASDDNDVIPSLH